MITISYGQALLILIDRYQSEAKPDLAKIAKLKQFYLSGPETGSQLLHLEELIAEGKKRGWLKDYEISKDTHVIDEDASRRQFETQLALCTLQSALKDIDMIDLKSQYLSILDQITLGSYKNEIDLTVKSAERLSQFEGQQYYDKLKSVGDTEFVDALWKIQSKKYYLGFKSDEREKLKYLILMALSCLNLMHDKSKADNSLPIDIYECHNGYFASHHRGRIEKPDQRTVTSFHPGIFKSYHPVSQELSFNPVSWEKKDKNWIAKSELDVKQEPILRSCIVRFPDRQRYDHKAKWPKHHFSKLVHPFSHSISGTLLCVFRTFRFLEDERKLSFNNLKKLSAFLKCFTSVLLYNSGGHTFYEFMAVLSIPDIQEAFEFLNTKEEKDTPFHVRKFSELNLDSLLRQTNEIAFEKALDSAIKYNTKLLAQARVNQDIRDLKSQLVAEFESLIDELQSKKNPFLDRYIEIKHTQFLANWKLKKREEIDVLRMEIRFLKPLTKINYQEIVAPDLTTFVKTVQGLSVIPAKMEEKETKNRYSSAKPAGFSRS